MLNDYGIKSMGQSIGVLEVKKLMVKIAKWQQERMYSEDDMKLAWENGRNGTSTVGSFPFVTVKFIHNSFKKWFEQFKKK
jgi:hypothetical protein